MCPSYTSYLGERSNILGIYYNLNRIYKIHEKHLHSIISLYLFLVLGKECEIKVKKYKPVWKKMADAIIADLLQMFSPKAHRAKEKQVPIIHGIYHIGSTAVVGLSAKPIIDFMLMLKPNVGFDSAVAKIKNNIVFNREKYPFKIGFTGKSHIDGRYSIITQNFKNNL